LYANCRICAKVSSIRPPVKSRDYGNQSATLDVSLPAGHPYPADVEVQQLQHDHEKYCHPKILPRVTFENHLNGLSPGCQTTYSASRNLIQSGLDGASRQRPKVLNLASLQLFHSIQLVLTRPLTLADLSHDISRVRLGQEMKTKSALRWDLSLERIEFLVCLGSSMGVSVFVVEVGGCI
jgi:hypothetical protein